MSISDGWFVDEWGRRALFRGVNLGGDSKLPTGMTTADPAAWTPNLAPITFVGRPFPLESADEHLRRIRDWGFNILRLVMTWEAVEHEGPGTYDEAYLEFLREVVKKAAGYGLMVFVDPHQDVWSRFTGGDGAPLWTFDIAGLDASAFRDAGAVQLNSFDWFHNYQTVPVSTMWTLFFAGDEYCPELRGAQEELQGRFIAMLATVAERLADLDNVLGYDSCNEPSGGYIGRGEDLASPVTHFVGDGTGPRAWSALEHLAAADGLAIAGEDGRTLNPGRRSIWARGCPWRRAGVWTLDPTGRPTIGDAAYFTRFANRDVDLWADFMAPFVRRLHAALRRADPDCILFAEPPPHYLKNAASASGYPECDARHWYDLPTLSTRRFDPDGYRTTDGSLIRGEAAIAKQFTAELGLLRDWNRQHMGGAPLLIGEFGLPYDINGKDAYSSGDFDRHEIALAAYYSAMDANLISSTQWNYSASNNHSQGDGWNFEDLSMWSADDPNGRAEGAFCRPYVRRSAGRPMAMSFDHRSGDFELTISPDQSLEKPSEIFVPALHYGRNPEITVSTGTVTYSADGQTVEWAIKSSAPATLKIAKSSQS